MDGGCFIVLFACEEVAAYLFDCVSLNHFAVVLGCSRCYGNWLISTDLRHFEAFCLQQVGKHLQGEE